MRPAPWTDQMALRYSKEHLAEDGRHGSPDGLPDLANASAPSAQNRIAESPSTTGTRRMPTAANFTTSSTATGPVIFRARSVLVSPLPTCRARSELGKSGALITVALVTDLVDFSDVLSMGSLAVGAGNLDVGAGLEKSAFGFGRNPRLVFGTSGRSLFKRQNGTAQGKQVPIADCTGCGRSC
jgi:hypothetical protein